MTPDALFTEVIQRRLPEVYAMAMQAESFAAMFAMVARVPKEDWDPADSQARIAHAAAKILSLHPMGKT